MKFIGRKHEIDALKSLRDKPSASLVIMKGRRRIGKSRLAKEFGQNYKFYSFSGIPPSKQETNASQRKFFSLQLEKYFHYPVKDNWFDMLHTLGTQTMNEKAVILMDEISWMSNGDDDFLGILKTMWDQIFSQNPKLIMIVCSSIASWIDKNILSNTGFVGRISLTLTLKELSLPECAQIWPAECTISPTEKLKMLSVTGGVPRYLEEINTNLSAEYNIKKMCFEPSGVLYTEFDQIFSDLFSKKNAMYKNIITTLADGNKDRLGIATTLGISDGGMLSEYLEDLETSGFISRDFTWIINSGKESNLSTYRLSDNYVRFYLKYIEPNKNKIKKGGFSDIDLSTLNNWYGILGLQFENLVKSNRQILLEQLSITNSSVVQDGGFFQRTTKRHPGCQIDYMIQTKENILYLCEIKTSKNAISANVIDEVKNKIKNLIVPKNFSILPILIFCGTLSEELDNSGYFARKIDFTELL